MVTLRVVQSPADWKAFVEFPWKIYAGQPFWVSPPQLVIKSILNPRENPFFRHAETLPLLAIEDGQILGRVLGIVDYHHQSFHQDKTGFFGFFECKNHPEASRLLLEEVIRWGKARGLDCIRGPIDLSSNDTLGLLVEGFEDSPTFLTPYHFPYYQGLIEQVGFVKTKDLLAFELEKGKSRFADRLLAQAERTKKKSSIRVREMDLSRFESEVKTILDIYNDAWERNWGFVPMTPEEFQHKAKEMKPLLDPRLCLILEVNQVPAAFALALPDINQVFKKIPFGKLFPFGFFKLFWYLKGPGRKTTINRCRILTLGVKKQFQELGLGPLLYTEYLTRGPALGYPRGEASWILEDNRPMCRALELMGARKTKTYRLYDYRLTPQVS